MSPIALVVLIVGLWLVYKWAKAWSDHEKSKRSAIEEFEERQEQIDEEIREGKRRVVVEGDRFVEYSPDTDKVNVPLSDILIVAEVTTDDGPAEDDHFIAIQIHGESVARLWPIILVPETTLNSLLAKLGGRRTESLEESTSFESRIMYPTELWGQRIFDLQIYIRSGAHRYTEAVKEYFERVDETDNWRDS
jgi:hypothetical protein